MNLPERKRTIVLYVPPSLDGVGGVQVQIVNLARELSSESYPDVRTIVFASQGSFVDLSLSPEASPSLELRTWESRNESLPENSLLLMWAGFRTVARFKKSNPFVLMWSVAPNQPFSHFSQAASKLPLLKLLFDRACKRTVRYLARHSSLVCMDLQNLQAMQVLAGERFAPSYLPVGLPVTHNSYTSKTTCSGNTRRLSAAWVGRGSVNWKVIPLACFLRDASLPDCGIKLTIYTDSTSLYEKVFASMLSEEQMSRIELRYEKGVVGSELTNRLATRADINVGMGLSVLEGAAVGVPSVYVAPQTDSSERAYWQWVYNREQNDFGRGPFFGDCHETFDMRTLHAKPSALMQHSQKSFSYAFKFHRIALTASLLLDHKAEGTLKGYLQAHGKMFSSLAMLGSA